MSADWAICNVWYVTDFDVLLLSEFVQDFCHLFWSAKLSNTRGVVLLVPDVLDFTGLCKGTKTSKDNSNIGFGRM